MRISSTEAIQAVDIITKQYGDEVAVWLFGSRAYDDRRGGDVDLYVETTSSDLMQKLRCKSLLVDLFEMDVGLVVGTGNKPLHRIAKQTGVRLK